MAGDGVAKRWSKAWQGLVAFAVVVVVAGALLGRRAASNRAVMTVVPEEPTAATAVAQATPPHGRSASVAALRSRVRKQADRAFHVEGKLKLFFTLIAGVTRLEMLLSVPFPQAIRCSKATGGRS